MKEHKDLTVIFKLDKQGNYIASVPDLEGCRVIGKSMEEVKEKIKDAILKCLGCEKDSSAIRLESADGQTGNKHQDN